LGIYEYETIGVEIADNASVYLDSVNGPQPDIALILNTDRGGQTRITEGDYVAGPPELIAEISASTVSTDLGCNDRTAPIELSWVSARKLLKNRYNK
jgi:hypothetical protein